MSSGVSDQMKVPGNSAKTVEERNIPWSQQVDEAAAFEILASPATDDISAANQSSMQFQYPPFNAKEATNLSWNSYKTRKSSNNTETNINKKYGKPAFYNNAKTRDDFQPNAWGTPITRRADNPGNYNRSTKSDENYITGKLDNRAGGLGVSTDEKTAIKVPVASAPKKTTWASIASQPAKLTSRATLTTSSHKKKGPGMPPPPMVPGKHNLDVNTWDMPNNNPPLVPSPPPPIEVTYTDVNPGVFAATAAAAAVYKPEHEPSPDKGQRGNEFLKDDNKSTFNSNNFGRVRNSPNGHSRKNWSQQHPLHQSRHTSSTVTAPTVPIRRDLSDNNSGPGPNRYGGDRRGNFGGARFDQDSTSYDVFRDENSPRNVAENNSSIEEITTDTPQAVLNELRDKNNYNPAEIDLEKAATARFFVIKSYSEDDIHRSIKYEIWCSTDHGNKRLDDAFKERHKEGGNILLFFSVNGSGHFCGMAQMMTAVDYNSTSSVWSQDKWKGKFKVKWIYVKDVPNIKLRHIRLENNDNKSVTNSRDTQEVPNAQGIEVLQILHAYKHSTSIFDDFYHYEKKQEEEVSSKKPLPHDPHIHTHPHSPVNRHFNRQNDDRDRDRDRDGRGSIQKYIGGGGNSGGANFRDRNIAHRGYHNNFNDHRRFESHRIAAVGTTDYQSKERDLDADRDNNDYGGSRHTQKFDYNRRGDDRTQTKLNNRGERDFSEEHGKSSDARFRIVPRDMQKDNEYQNADRHRATTTEY